MACVLHDQACVEDIKDSNSVDNDSVDSNNKGSTTNCSANYNNMKDSNKDYSKDNRKRILLLFRMDNLNLHKHLCSSRHCHRRSNNRKCLRDSRSRMRFYNCHRNIFLY